MYRQTKSLAIILMSIIVLSIANTSQAAQEKRCAKKIPSNQTLDQNTQSGGHVGLHVIGYTPNYRFDDANVNSVDGKSLYESPAKYSAVLAAQYNNNQEELCTSGAPNGSKVKTQLTIAQGAPAGKFKKCLGTKQNAPLVCDTFSAEKTVSKYVFVYKKIDSKWVLLTSYPE